MNAPMNAKPGEHRGHRIVGGIDWGKQRDFTVFSIGCAECKVELALYRSNQLDYAFHIKKFGAYQHRWKMEDISVELNSIGEPNFEQMERDGLPVVGFYTTAKSKPPLIEGLALVTEMMRWQFLNIPVATNEMEAYERKVSPQTGRSSYGAPTGMNDDTVIARALMVRQAEEGGFTTA